MQIYKRYEEIIRSAYAGGYFFKDISERHLAYKVHNLKNLNERDNFKAEYLSFRNGNPFTNQRDAFYATLNKYYKDHHTKLGYHYEY